MFVLVMFFVITTALGFATTAFIALLLVWAITRSKENNGRNRYFKPFVVSGAVAGVLTVAFVVVLVQFINLDFRALPFDNMNSGLFINLRESGDAGNWTVQADRINGFRRRPFSAIGVGEETVIVVESAVASGSIYLTMAQDGTEQTFALTEPRTQINAPSGRFTILLDFVDARGVEVAINLFRAMCSS
ncbi:MAG: hypothetical protein FWG65_00245 [Turicibacter sp.]|nr:hypothetical protein [Turicibacter sp.]